MLIFAVSWLEEPNVQEFTVMPAPKLQVAPLWKLLPVMLTPGKLWPCAPEFGLTEFTLGGGLTPVTEKPFISVALPLSRLMTVTSRAPMLAAELMLILALSCVEALNVHEF